jgi:crotonobetainyl-CoA:carnitine CoA-transferase CaiB-like acyl-CoA transferase
MTKVLEGVRVVEVSLYGFVPSAGAVLADWGADVIKIEHPDQGDPMRGLVVSGIRPEDVGLTFMWEIVNRGKRSVAIDLGVADGRQLLLDMVAEADVFLTNFLPSARRKLGIDVEDIMGRNPGIVFARGSGQGPKGPEADKGGFDAISYWYRTGISAAVTPPDHPMPIRMPGPAFGDVQSGMMLAGGIGAALAYRARTGQGVVVDVSLLAAGLWAMQPGVLGTQLTGADELPKPARVSLGNPLVNTYRTADGRFVALNMLQGDRYWADLCTAMGRPDLIDDPELATADLRAEHVDRCVAVLDDLFGRRSLAEWQDVLSRQDGQWDVVRVVREANDDTQALANGYVTPVTFDDGRVFNLVSAPVQFDETAPELRPGPALGAHTEEVLLEMGRSWDEIGHLKEAKAII